MAGKLSPAMLTALGKLSRVRWYAPCELGIRMPTIKALVERGLIQRNEWMEAWRLTDKGERRRKAEAVIELVRRA